MCLVSDCWCSEEANSSENQNTTHLGLWLLLFLLALNAPRAPVVVGELSDFMTVDLMHIACSSVSTFHWNHFNYYKSKIKIVIKVKVWIMQQ